MKSIGVTFDEALLALLDQQPEVQERGRSAVLRSAVADYLAAKESPASEGTPLGDLSLDFLSRLLTFVEWRPGWDGNSAEHVDHVTAARAIALARTMRAVAPEPFVAPAASGALLLQWDLPGGTSVEVFVDSDSEFPQDAALTSGGQVHEVALSGQASLRALLLEHAVPKTVSQ